MSSVTEFGPVHIRLAFNGMVMTVSDDIASCHQQAKFWLPWSNFNRVEGFLKLNNIPQVQDKKIFGILVANGIVRLRT